MKPILFALLFCFLSAGPSFAEDLLVPPGSPMWSEVFNPPFSKPTEIPTNMPLRRELFDQLRPRIQSKAKRPIRFEGSLRAFKNWAFFVGNTVDENGKIVMMPPMDNPDTVALWLNTRDGWRLIDFSGGHSDAFYTVWSEQYGAPKALIDF